MRFLSIFVIFSIAAPVAARQPEPKYRDHPLHYWVDKLTHTESDAERKEAIEAVKAFPGGVSELAPLLVGKLDDLSEDYRKTMMDAFIDLEPGAQAKAVVPDLIKLLEAKSPREPESLIRMLCAIGPDAKSAIPAIQRYLLKENSSYGSDLTSELTKLGPEIVPLFMEMLRTAEKDAKTSIWRQLRELGPAAKKAAPAIAPYLKDADNHMRIQAAHTLGVIANSPEARAMLLEDLKNADVEIRLGAAGALTDLGRPEAAVAVLMDVVRKYRKSSEMPNYGRVDYALSVLGQYGSAAKSVLPELQGFLEQNPAKNSPERRVYDVHLLALKHAIFHIERGK